MQITTSKKFLDIITGVLITGFGLFMIFQTENFAMVIAVVTGIIISLNGISQLGALKTNLPYDLKRRKVFSGTVSLIAGIAVILLPLLFVKITWIIALYFIAFELLVTNIYRLLVNKRYQAEGKAVFPISSIVFGFLTAFFLFIAPNFIGLFLMRVFGILVIMYGLGILVFSFKMGRLQR